eukprot:gene987-1343_t
MATFANRKRSQDFPALTRDRRPKLLSSIGNVSLSEQNEQNEKEYQNDPIHENYSSSRDHPVSQNTSKPEIQEAYAAPEVVKRSKRLFSSLIGHLGSAKKKLDEDQETILRQTTLVRSITKKSADEFKKLRERKRREYELSVQTKRVEEKVGEIERISKAWQTQMKYLTEFAFTQTKPSIAWLPKFNNANTKLIIENRKKEIEDLISQRVQDDEQRVLELKAELAEQEREMITAMAAMNGDEQDQEEN